MSDLVAMFLVGYFMVCSNWANPPRSVAFWGGVILIILAVIGFSVGHFTGVRG